jgi:hypothetical protein
LRTRVLKTVRRGRGRRPVFEHASDVARGTFGFDAN